MVIGLTLMKFPNPINNADLHRLAESMGVRLVRHDNGVKGWYCHETRTISTRRGMSIAAYRSTLAHELGHAHYGDIPQENGYYHQRQEKRAWDYAASLLIDKSQYTEAATWHDHDQRAIADELEITHHLLTHWSRKHTEQKAS